MTCRYTAYGITTCLFSLVLWYYIAIFCGIYESSSIGWIKSTVISISIDWLGLSIIAPLLLSGIRVIMKCSPALRYLILYIELNL